MPSIVSPSQEPVLQVAAADAGALDLRLEAGAPAAVRIEVQSMCNCHGTSRRPGSYTDTDFGRR